MRRTLWSHASASVRRASPFVQRLRSHLCGNSPGIPYRRAEMARYLIRATYTAEGARGLLKEGGSKRRATLEQLVQKIGGSLEAFYFAFGEDDVYVLARLPDNVTAAAVGLTVSAAGAVRTSTVVLLTPEEIDEAAKKSVEYRAPGA
jgi:uncharacterized protein with GYD domain